MDYFVPKTSIKIMLKTSLDLILALHMSLEDSIKWLGEVMAEIGPSHSQKNEEWNVFNIKQANAVIDYLKIRYGFFFSVAFIFSFHYLLQNVY